MSRLTRLEAAGDRLYGVPGSAYVEEAAADEQEQTYNLVVADFRTYFIGRALVLSHDNTPCPPTRNAVPGRRR